MFPTKRAVDRLFDDVRSKLGGLDVLVNNAGIAGPTGKIEDLSLADWRRTLDVDLTGQFLCARRAVPMLKQAGGGAIINMSSAAGRFGYAFRTPYAAAKWGVIGLTQSLAKELGPSNIRVNAILPGVIKGPRMEKVIRDRAEADRRAVRGHGKTVSGPHLAAPHDRSGRCRRHGGVPGISGGPQHLRPVAGRGWQCRVLISCEALAGAAGQA